MQIILLNKEKKICIKNNSSYIHTIQPVLSKYSPFLSVTDDDTLATVAMKVKNIEEEK